MMCTGTLIQDPYASSASSRWILTAAHCGSHPDDRDSEFFVSCDGVTVGLPTRVSRVHRHPDFRYGDFGSDIALLEVETAFEAEELPEVYFPEDINALLSSAQSFHQFEVEVIDSGVSGAFGQSRFRRDYSFIHADQPMVRCSAFGYGKDKNNEYGHLQSQGLSITYFLDLQPTHVFLSLTWASHGVQINSGDSGGPILCHTDSGSRFVLGVHSHSMEAGLSFSSPAFTYASWIESVQSISARTLVFVEAL